LIAQKVPALRTPRAPALTPRYPLARLLVIKVRHPPPPQLLVGQKNGAAFLRYSTRPSKATAGSRTVMLGGTRRRPTTAPGTVSSAMLLDM
jgi:hypothetical protein